MFIKTPEELRQEEQPIFNRARVRVMWMVGGAAWILVLVPLRNMSGHLSGQSLSILGILFVAYALATVVAILTRQSGKDSYTAFFGAVSVAMTAVVFNSLVAIILRDLIAQHYRVGLWVAAFIVFLLLLDSSLYFHMSLGLEVFGKKLTAYYWSEFILLTALIWVALLPIRLL